jgi:hypothetical protein
MFVSEMGAKLFYQLTDDHLDWNIAMFYSEIFIDLSIDKTLQTLFF